MFTLIEDVGGIVITPEKDILLALDTRKSYHAMYEWKLLGNFEIFVYDRGNWKYEICSRSDYTKQIRRKVNRASVLRVIQERLAKVSEVFSRLN